MWKPWNTIPRYRQQNFLGKCFSQRTLDKWNTIAYWKKEKLRKTKNRWHKQKKTQNSGRIKIKAVTQQIN